MPATYAHYRFGAQMLNRMPADLGRAAKRHRRLFDVGLHGPDLFFYYHPAFHTRVGKLGSKFHKQTGREFFSRVCRNLRLEPSEAGQAYLYGVLCHYALDTQCHPLVEHISADAEVSHTRIETEFDRYLLELDNKPSRMNLTKHLQLTRPECEIVSRFYPGTEPGHIREGLNGMVRIRKALEMPDGRLRDMVSRTISLGSDTFRDMVEQIQPEPRYREWNRLLFERYQQSAKMFPDMLLRLAAHLAYNAPLTEGFDPIFG